ncbi:MAG: Gfo/Idh/MocA family oxidoreductase, partial [Planctomycetaceae bacterium]|nr:Gfo/Idh/MocA family oxidoreductase [Planctomycetaceae bacterium]
GSFHADKIVANKDLKLVSVMDTVQSVSEKLSEKHGVESFTDLRLFLKTVDAVVIAAPTSLHYELGVETLKQKKHLLIEKPICNNSDDAEKLVELADTNKVVLQVGHIEEFNPAWYAAKSYILDFADKKPIIIDAIRTSGYTFRSTDVGAALDLMIHDIDLVLSITPSKTTFTSAAGFNIIGGKHEDITDARVEFENGTVAHFFASRVSIDAVRTMQIMAAHGKLNIDFAQKKIELQKIAEKVSAGEFASERIKPDELANIQPIFMKEFFEKHKIDNLSGDALEDEIKDFANAVKTGKPPKVTGERGLKAVKLAEKILKSMRCN